MMLKFKRFEISFFPYDDQICRTAFGIQGKETLIPIPDSSVAIGQRNGMSDIDIHRVNILYKCWWGPSARRWYGLTYELGFVCGPGGNQEGGWPIWRSTDKDLWVWLSRFGHFYLIVKKNWLNKTAIEKKKILKPCVVISDFMKI